MRKFTVVMAMVAMGAIVAPAVQAADRDTPERDGRFVQVTAGAAIDAGMMIAILPADGEAYMATDATATLAVIGRAESSAAEGDTLLAKRGVFRWDNAGAFTAADIGQQCYAFGNASVTTATIATNDIPAGVIIDYDTSGVWVDTYNQTLNLTTSVTTLDVTGNATVGGTLDVTGNATLTAAPTFVLTNAPAAITATLTNAPALDSAAAPRWIKVTVGTDSCVIPAWVLD